MNSLSCWRTFPFFLATANGSLIWLLRYNWDFRYRLLGSRSRCRRRPHCCGSWSISNSNQAIGSLHEWGWRKGVSCRSPHGIHQQPIVLLPLRCLFAVVVWHFRSCFTIREAEFLFNCLLLSRILYGWVSNGPNKTCARGIVGPVFA